MQQISLGEAMKQRRLELGLSQEIVCDGICETATLSRLENGRQTMSYNRVKALMQRLNMPDDRFYALLSQQETELDNARRELLSHYVRFARAGEKQKRQTWRLAMEQLQRLESLAEKEDTITQQLVLSYKALLGREDGPYSLEKRLEMQLTALRLTVPKFDLEQLSRRRYSLDETQLMNQVAGTYSINGDHSKAIRLYQQLFDYANKCSDRLSTYANYLTLIAHNYSRELAIRKYYYKAVEVAEQGKCTSVNYGFYQYLPGFLAIMGECYYQLGEEEKSKKLCVQAHYLYEVLGDERSLNIIDPDIQQRFSIKFPC